MFFKKTIKILIALFIIAAAVTLWIFFGGENRKSDTENRDSSSAIFKEEKNEKSDSISTAPPASAQTKQYKSTQYGFSFNYLADFTASEFSEDEGKISLIIQNGKTGQTVQIYITHHNDPDFAESAEKIKMDLPDLPLTNSADVIV